MEAPFRIERRFEDDSPNQKASPTKFGDESIWNTTLLNEASDPKRDSGAGKPCSEAPNAIFTQKQNFIRTQGCDSAAMSQIKLGNSPRLHTEMKEANSPTFTKDLAHVHSGV